MVNPNWPTINVNADFQHGANAGVQTWSSLQSGTTTTVAGFRTKRGRQYELGKVEAGTANIDVFDFGEYLNPSNTTSPFNSGSNSLAPYRQCQITATWSGTTYNIFNGYIERYPVAWDNAGYRGVRQLTCVDAMALIAKANVQNAARQQAVLLYSPLVYFPLNDTSPSFPGALNELVYGGFTWTSNPLPFTFGYTSPLGFADGQTCAFVSGSAPNSTSPSLSTYVGGAATTTACTVRAIVSYYNNSTTSPQFGLNCGSVWILITPDSASTGFDIIPVAYDGTNLVSTTYVSTAKGQALDLVVTSSITAGTGTITLFVNGVQVVQTTGTLTSAPVNQVQFYLDLSSSSNSANATISDIAIWSSVLNQTQITDLYYGGSTGWNGEPTIYNSASSTGKGRIKRILDTAAWLGYGSPRLDDQNTSGHGGQSAEYNASGWAGKSIKSLIEQSVTTEDGNFFIGNDGNIVVQDRQTRRAIGTSLYTFGDGAGELPYEDIAYSLDPTQIYNTVSVNNVTGTNATSTNATSVTQYFTNSLSISTDYRNATDIALRAQWATSKYAQPVFRVEKLVLNPSSTPTLWPAVLNLELGNVVTVNRRNAGTTITGTYYVESIEHDVSPGRWLTTLWLSPTSVQRALILDDATYGVLDTYPISN